MKPKLICDSCGNDLKVIQEDDETVYIIKDTIGGLSVWKHNNCPNHIVICEGCEETLRNDLTSQEQWHDLDILDNTPNMVDDFFQNFDNLKITIEMLNKDGN